MSKETSTWQRIKCHFGFHLWKQHWWTSGEGELKTHGTEFCHYCNEMKTPPRKVVK